MPAKSKKQRQFFGMVRRCQKTGECPSEKVKKVAKKISPEDAHHFAKKKKHFDENSYPTFTEWLQESYPWMLGSPPAYEPHGLGMQGGIGTSKAPSAPFLPSKPRKCKKCKKR